MNATNTKEILVEFFITYGLQLLGAALIVFGGLVLSRWVGNIMQRALDRQELEPPIKKLIIRVVKLLVIVFTLMIALDKSGVQIMPLVAGIGVAGVGVGLAMQGVLSNLIAGLTILFSKPFRVGEYVEIHGEVGLVADIELLTTTLTQADRSRVLIPNRRIIGEILHNYGMVRQLDLRVGVAYAANLKEAISLIERILNENKRVLKDPKPAVGILELGDSSVNIAVKPWVPLADFGAARGEIYQAILESFRATGIEIPFPQRDIWFRNALAGGTESQAN